MNRLFHDYQALQGRDRRVNGVLLANEAGEAVAYALFNLEDRGPMIIDAGEKVYMGMIIYIHSRDNDLEVNVLKGKKLTNTRRAAIGRQAHAADRLRSSARSPGFRTTSRRSHAEVDSSAQDVP